MKKIQIHKLKIKDKDIFCYHIYQLLMLALVSGIFRESMFTIFLFLAFGLAFLTLIRKVYVIADRFIRSYYEKRITEEK